LLPQFTQVCRVQPLRLGYRPPIPPLPFAGLVAAQKEDRGPTRVEDEEHAKAEASPIGDELLQVREPAVLDRICIWAPKLRAMLLDLLDNLVEGCRFFVIQVEVPGLGLIRAFDVPPLLLAHPARNIRVDPYPGQAPQEGPDLGRALPQL